MLQPTISSSDRIRELSAINADVPTLVSSMGHAVNALSGRQLHHNSTDGTTNGDITMDNGDEVDNESLHAHKQAFTKHATAYFTHLQSIMARLRRQAYALEEAGIIAAEAPTLSTTSSLEPSSNSRSQPGQGAGVRRGPLNTAQGQRQPVEESERITNGGLGSLDVGYLNSRGNKVGMEKEAELMAEARTMLEGMAPQRHAENGHIT